MPNEPLSSERRGAELMSSLRQLSDAELVARVRHFVARERDDTAHLVAHLAELDTRDIHLRAGYGSLFAYCRDALGLSEHAAYNRIEAARAARRFPVILEMLAEGSVNLTTVRLLAPHLTAGNCRKVLESARGKRKSEVEEIVAGLSPRPDVASSVRRLPAPKLAPPAVSIDVEAPVALALVSHALPSPACSTTPAPLSPDRYKVQFMIGGETLEKLRLVKDMLRHAIPSGDHAAILDRALTALLSDLARKKFASTEQPRPARGTGNGSRHIPAEVKRAVWLRDLGRCAFVGASRRCGERAFLEFHHVKPYAVGGEATVENVQLRCRQHNAHEAREYFGRYQPDDALGFVPGESTPPRGSSATRSGTSCGERGRPLVAM